MEAILTFFGVVANRGDDTIWKSSPYAGGSESWCRLYPLALVAFLIFPTTSGHTSRARVEATGSLEFLLEDETTSLTPFQGVRFSGQA